MSVRISMLSALLSQRSSRRTKASRIISYSCWDFSRSLSRCNAATSESGPLIDGSESWPVIPLPSENLRRCCSGSIRNACNTGQKMNRPSQGIATDASHSTKNGLTRYRGIDLLTGIEVFHEDLGNQTVNVGEFLGVVAAAKYIIEHNYTPRIIYTDSLTAIVWFTQKRTASKKIAGHIQDRGVPANNVRGDRQH